MGDRLATIDMGLNLGGCAALLGGGFIPMQHKVTYHVTYHVRPHQPIIDQQGIWLRGLVHKEAHPVIPDLH